MSNRFRYPISHPIIKNRHEFPGGGRGFSKEEIDGQFGVYQCTVLFPRAAAPPVFPVLPQRIGQKTVFSICKYAR